MHFIPTKDQCCLTYFCISVRPRNGRYRSTGPHIKRTYLHVLDSGWFYNQHELYGHKRPSYWRYKYGAPMDSNVTEFVRKCQLKVRKGVSLVEMSSDHGPAPGRWHVITWPKDGLVFLTHTSINRTARLNGLTMDIKLTDYCQSTSVFLLSVWLISCFQKSWCNYVQISVVIATLAHLMPSGLFVLLKVRYFSNVMRSHYHIIYCSNAVVSSRPSSTHIWVSIYWAVKLLNLNEYECILSVWFKNQIHATHFNISANTGSVCVSIPCHMRGRCR